MSTTARITKTVAGVLLVGLTLFGTADLAAAGRWTPSLAVPAMNQGPSCGTNGEVSVALSHNPVTKSRKPGWSYSLFYAGDGRNPWVVSNWTAVYANTGYQQHWELVNNQWKAPVAGSIDVSVPPHYRNTQVWELRYEIVNGSWTYEWIYLGTCTPPPGF